MSRIDRATDHLHFLFRDVGSFISQDHDAPHLFLDELSRFGQIAGRRREMTGHHMELLGDLPALHRDALGLLANRIGTIDERIELLFQTAHRLHRAIHENSYGHHCRGNHQK
jgi:hypothetical protein